MMSLKFNEKTILKMNILLVSALVFSSCDKSADSFSLASEEKNFQQTAQHSPRAIDILWVVDNSGSMNSSQTNLVNNFASFINRFKDKGYDFQMGVTTTDAYLSDYAPFNPQESRLFDGLNGNRSGVYVMTPETTNLTNVFAKNIRTGTGGYGDERAFASMKATLLNPWSWNQSFRRPNAFLAVIIISDEEDFSQTTDAPYEDLDFSESYSNPALIPVANYKTWLDSFTGQKVNGPKMYSVNAITIKDTACRDELNLGFNGRKVAPRVVELAQLTGGLSESLCGNFADSLNLISESVVALSTSFVLERDAIASSIIIKVDGVSLLKDVDFFYDVSTRTISFSPTAAPVEGSNIYVFYDPVTIKQ